VHTCHGKVDCTCCRSCGQPAWQCHQKCTLGWHKLSSVAGSLPSVAAFFVAAFFVPNLKPPHAAAFLQRWSCLHSCVASQSSGAQMTDCLLLVLCHSITCCLATCRWSLELGAWSLELGAWSLELGAWSLELGAWSLQLAACSLQLGAWSLQLAAWSLQLAACSLQLAACSLQLAACSLQLAACSPSSVSLSVCSLNS
jgi:hypothetical protein